MEFTGDILENTCFKNISPTPSQATVNLGSQLSLQLNNQSLLRLNPQYTSSYQVAKYDNITDYSGTSGDTPSNLTGKFIDFIEEIGFSHPIY
ncbi:choice-of-anchor E domain-containing protein [uncultured Nostoc sp.]|uniref:choice-of-anchor E domain-containing protein n=1 Tax=uncultured Nostoc sp. TaxID=340711 RepID=UPI0035CA566F